MVTWPVKFIQSPRNIGIYFNARKSKISARIRTFFQASRYVVNGETPWAKYIFLSFKLGQFFFLDLEDQFTIEKSYRKRKWRYKNASFLSYFPISQCGRSAYSRVYLRENKSPVLSIIWPKSVSRKTNIQHNLNIFFGNFKKILWNIKSSR